jgi:hypothetical protein
MQNYSDLAANVAVTTLQAIMFLAQHKFRCMLQHQAELKLGPGGTPALPALQQPSDFKAPGSHTSLGVCLAL